MLHAVVVDASSLRQHADAEPGQQIAPFLADTLPLLVPHLDLPFIELPNTTFMHARLALLVSCLCAQEARLQQEFLHLEVAFLRLFEVNLEYFG